MLANKHHSAVRGVQSKCRGDAVARQQPCPGIYGQNGKGSITVMQASKNHVCCTSSEQPIDGCINFIRQKLLGLRPARAGKGDALVRTTDKTVNTLHVSYHKYLLRLGSLRVSCQRWSKN